MKKGFTTPLVIAIMAFAVVAFLFLIDTSINPDGSSESTNQPSNESTNSTACTLEAKLCPDGSSVGRSGPNCEFTACPTISNTNTVSTSNSNGNGNTNTAAATSLRVVFTDKQTGDPIVQTAVSLYSDNGVRCVTEPCSTNGRTTEATTDAQGAVLVAASAVDESMTFTLAGYQAKELHGGGTLQADGSWKLPLNKK